MFRVSFAPRLNIDGPNGSVLNPRAVELLIEVEQHGTLAAACSACGISYRHAWQLLREGEQMFGQPLLTMSRGKGALLAPLGERLVWAQRRVQARLAPALESLASELGAEIEKLTTTLPSRMRIHASHGFAIQSLHDSLIRQGLQHELKYCGASEALASLSNGQCDIAGFHIPIGRFEAMTVEHYGKWLDPAQHRLVRLATRRQGLMTQTGNPKKIYDVSDLARPDVRFVNRQAGSGTRFLLDQMLTSAGISSASVRGYEQCEFTHAAVAAFVASGMADAGMGVEPPARQFKLEFMPLLQERYVLLCRADYVEAPDFEQMIATLQTAEFQRSVDALPGYSTDKTGAIQNLAEVMDGPASGPGRLV